jgi:tRNA-specific 2-thiouridylase
MKSTVAVAVSGGIDSLVAAFLLKEKGHRVFGIHFATGYEKKHNHSATSLNGFTDRHGHHLDNPLHAIGEQLQIPIEIVDLSNPFKQLVVNYFTRSYNFGKTPNPCLVCNPEIKFGFLLDRARLLGAQTLATGHYARVEKDENGSYRLLRGIDSNKDQSYFLAFMTQDKLSRARFPLGGMTKNQVRDIAIKNGLEPISKDESQDVCFISGQKYSEFLEICPKPGPIVDLNGRNIGEHQGLHLFTIGQRKGINCPATEPYYVLRIDVPDNRLVVGSKIDLYQKACRVERVNWIRRPPEKQIRVQTKVRYRHTAVPTVVMMTGNGCAKVSFEKAQPSITPGQGAVFYDEDEVLGGGWIA